MGAALTPSLSHGERGYRKASGPGTEYSTPPENGAN